MDIKELLKELKNGIIDLVKEKLDVESKEVNKEIRSIVNQSKEKLERWSLLLKNGDLTKDDFLWLVESQRDLLQLQSLKAIGISQIKLGHFKSRVIELIGQTVFKFIF